MCEVLAIYVNVSPIEFDDADNTILKECYEFFWFYVMLLSRSSLQLDFIAIFM